MNGHSSLSLIIVHAAVGGNGSQKRTKASLILSREASAGLGYIYVDEEHCLASMHCPALLPS